jgi:hypothetical protein
MSVGVEKIEVALDPNDICFYPRSGKVFFRGIGLITRVGEMVDLWDGED